MRPSKAERTAWLAGIIDGEGCLIAHFVNVGKAPLNPSGNLDCRIDIHVASPRMIEAIEKVYNDIGVEYTKLPPIVHLLSRRPCWKIRVRKRASVILLLQNILPNLRVKDAEAILMLKFFQRHPIENGETRSSDKQRCDLVDGLKGLKKVA